MTPIELMPGVDSQGRASSTPQQPRDYAEPSPLPPPRAFPRRHPGLVALAVLAAYSLFWALVGAGLAWWWVGF